ncbi:MAG TPA: replication initiator protein A [Steroidobacteraceae bacterium]|nr:replication initiator protein A [Steroidobacteraceae bacterium]
MSPRRFYNPQFDLFLPSIVDLKFRDQKDTMERPFFSLSKSKRMKPIEYQNDNDGIFVTVLPHQDYGMATIWDADVLIWAASVLSDMKNRRLNEIPRELKFQPHDLLKVIGRSTGGKDYAQLRGALDRLKSTIINTNIRAARGTKHITFSWIDQWEDLVDSRTKESRGLTLTLSDWFYRGVTEEGGVLSIDPAYFSISGGRERWLYRVARKHAGGNGAEGFAISMPTLFEKSGAEGTYRRFKFEMQRIVARNDLPGFLLTASQGEGEPILHMVRRNQLSEAEQVAWQSNPRPSRPRPAPAADRSPGPPPLPLLRPLLRTLSDRGIERIRADFPGWDVYALKAEFDTWIDQDSARQPKDYEAAFYGFVRQHHQRNQHQLHG